MAEKESKLQNIRETASDAVEIMRELGTPGVQETFDKIREVAIIAKDIMETMKTPEWQQNLENIAKITDNMNSASEKMNSAVKEIKSTGIIDEAKGLIVSTRGTIDTLRSEGGMTVGFHEVREITLAVREMLESIKSLTDELRLAAKESRRSGTLRNVGETISEARSVYDTIDSAARNQQSKQYPPP